ncbi:altronate dehydratase family protein [uncultured Parasphingorhabdus sp.]|uniref:UxaA family hydrolase n=1 Tax=uncultured Parasphingorhabdus sp. TaxID=2709694 RepID=UPI0030DC85B6|tara:strand:- start:71493 stop:73016 length:1524 start_codon:yes stop_codon:yes gene_type:complete
MTGSPAMDHDPAAAPLALQIYESDNVATMLADGRTGDTVFLAGGQIGLRSDVAKGHKLAIRPITAGTNIIKYGFPIGLATADIAAGEHVHSHNLKSGLSATGSYEYRPASAAKPAPAENLPVFRGYQRADGRVGTRNEIWIIPSVGCVGNLAERIARKAEVRYAGKVDAVRAFKHPFGCSQLGKDLSRTSKILASLAQHPNAGGVLMLGLGCESNQLAKMLEMIPEARRATIRSMTAQAEADEMESALALVDELVQAASACQRTEVPLSKLVLGVKCGGSDGFSGLTANPLVGRMADRVGEAGGKVILTEIPEIFGAEQLLMNRATNEDIFRRTVDLINDFKAYFTRHGEGLSDNPSPGNIAGGITTLEEKSLGAVQKGGHVPVVDVKLYGEQADRPGLTLLEAPGNDAVSSTALTAAGATMILFTTGRGTPLGFPAPTIKIASNSELARRKKNWIDFDAGQVLATGFDKASDDLLAKICAVASGEETAAERNGEHDIAIWKTGVTL